MSIRSALIRYNEMRKQVEDDYYRPYDEYSEKCKQDPTYMANHTCPHLRTLTDSEINDRIRTILLVEETIGPES